VVVAAVALSLGGVKGDRWGRVEELGGGRTLRRG